MTEATLFYAMQGKEFVGEEYLARNIRQAIVLARDIRRSRVSSGEIPSGQTTLGEYQMAYRRYINHRHASRREEEILTSKAEQVGRMEKNSKDSASKKVPMETKKTESDKEWKWVQENGRKYARRGGTMAGRRFLS